MYILYVCIDIYFRSRTDIMSLFIIFFFFFLLGRLLQKSLRLRSFRSDRNEIWQECSSKWIRINWESQIFHSLDEAIFKMAATTSFHAAKCCHLELLSENEASAARLCSNVYASSWSIVLVHSYLFSGLPYQKPLSFCLRYLSFCVENISVLHRIVQSAVLRLHVVCLYVCLSVRL